MINMYSCCDQAVVMMAVVYSLSFNNIVANIVLSLKTLASFCLREDKLGLIKLVVLLESELQVEQDTCGQNMRMYFVYCSFVS